LYQNLRSIHWGIKGHLFFWFTRFIWLFMHPY